MPDVQYIDLRIYLKADPDISVIGIGKLDTVNIMDSVVALHSSIQNANIDAESRKGLLSTPLGELLEAMKLVATQTVNAEEVTEDDPKVIEERNQLVRRKFRAYNSAACPLCNGVVLCCDGELQCVKCKTNFGNLWDDID